MCSQNDTLRALKDYLLDESLEESSLIEILHFTQDHYGYIPDEAQILIAERLHMSPAKIYGVVSFYSFFTQSPKGENQISICLGTACYVKGAQQVLGEFEKQLGIVSGETTSDGFFSISPTRCLGDCSQAPAVMINEDVFPNVKPSDVESILKKYSSGRLAEGVKA